jgi:LAO/AO transport system ATPase
VLEALLDRFRQGDRLALSRLLSLVARGDDIGTIIDGIRRSPRPSRVVAVTGGAGVGKSTLVGKLIEWVRGQGQTVAVLACDPQSPLSGGALLGDRFRMPSRPEDDGVFIRSLAAAGDHGALAANLDPMIRLLEAFGFEVILLETVGAGQGDTAVRDLADVVVLLLQPETGDDIQWDKAGLLEVANIVVIHKADLPGAESAEGQVRAALDLSGVGVVPVIRVSSKSGAGIEALWSAIADCPLRRVADALNGRDLLRLAQDILASRFAQAQAQGDARLDELIRRWRQGNVDTREAVFLLLHHLEALARPGSPVSPKAH